MTQRDAPSKGRVPARGVMIVVGYVVYLLIDNSQPVFPSALIGLGVTLVGLAEIDARMQATKDRSRLMEMAFRLLGVGLAVLGVFLVLR